MCERQSLHSLVHLQLNRNHSTNITARAWNPICVSHMGGRSQDHKDSTVTEKASHLHLRYLQFCEFCSHVLWVIQSWFLLSINQNETKRGSHQFWKKNLSTFFFTIVKCWKLGNKIFPSEKSVKMKKNYPIYFKNFWKIVLIREKLQCLFTGWL